MNFEQLAVRLFAASGPILRYRISTDLLDFSEREKERLYQDMLESPEVHRWLANLQQARSIHGSKDTNAENPLAKLLDYGLTCHHPTLADKFDQFLNCPLSTWDPLVFLPFLLRAGYSQHSLVNEWVKTRIERLYATAKQGSYDFYLSAEEARGVPQAWRGKPIYRDEIGHMGGYSLPTSYDFYALAYCPPVAGIDRQPEKLETIVAFLSDPRFQSTPGGYGWDRVKRRCYAAGRVFLACVEPPRLVLFMELGAIFETARRSTWFQQGLAILESYKTSDDTYCFPASMMTEKTGNHIYGGSHMGLGENRRSPRALELESTFRMLNILKRMGNM